MSSNILPAGRYPARTVEADLGYTKSNTEQVALGFEVLAGEHQGWRITGFFSFSEAAVDYTMEKLRNAGWQGDDISDLSSLCPSSTECSIVVRHEEYEGKTSAKVAFVNRSGGVKLAAPLDADQRASFAQRMRAKAIASRQAQEPQPAAQSPRAPTSNAKAPPKRSEPNPYAPGGASDGDIPF